MIESLKTVLYSEDFTKRHRLKASHFTRTRNLPFPSLVGLLLNRLTETLPLEWDRFFQVLKGLFERTDEAAQVDAETARKQAFSQARQTLSENALIEVQECLVDEFYTDHTDKTWKGFRVLGLDGSTGQLPMTESMLTEFGAVTNQDGPVMAMGRVSVLSAVENKRTVDAILATDTAAERDLAGPHLQALEAFDARAVGHQGPTNDLVLCDLGYPAGGLLAYLLLLGKEFVIRTSAECVQEVQEAIGSAQNDGVITIPVQTADRPLPEKLTHLVPTIDPDMVLTIRVIKLVLDDGTPEYLLPFWLAAERFPASDFPERYAKRGGSETNYAVFKNLLESENFPGQSPWSVRQDFHATVLTLTILGLIHWELQEAIDAENQSPSRHDAYKLNMTLSLGRLKDAIVTLGLGQGDLSDFYPRLKRQVTRKRVPIRPNRHFARKRKNHQKYTMTKRRAL